jgi:hypothetical protein
MANVISWGRARVLGSFGMPNYELTEEQQCTHNATLSLVMQELERCFPGTVLDREGKKDPKWRAHFKVHSQGPIDGSADVLVTGQHSNCKVIFVVPLLSPFVAALHQTAKDVKFYKELAYNLYPLDPASDEEIDGHIRYTLGVGLGCRIRVTYKLSGTGKTLEFHSAYPCELAEFLDILLGVDIKDTVKDRVDHPERYAMSEDMQF